MSKSFRENWLEAVERSGSVLCAGVDPAEYAMGRGEKGLPNGVDKSVWALEYVEAVAPFVAAVKPNLQYWKGEDDTETLLDMEQLAREKGIVTIDDSKLADIGTTNDAGVFYGRQRADAITFSPFAGNMEEAVGQARNRNVGLISMVLMSNPEFARQKNMLVPIDSVNGWREKDVFYMNRVGSKLAEGIPHVRQYVQLAHDAKKFGVDGVVIGAPSEKNHIESFEIETVRHYVGDEMLVLLPGVGAQGGEAGEIWNHFGRDDVIVNVGRGLMFPNGSKSTPEEQAGKAKEYRDMLNGLRST